MIKNYIKKLFQYEASVVLKKYKPKIIVIMGSVGKTSTKEMIYNLLSRKYFVRKTGKSFTNQLGIPLAILGCDQGSGSLFQWLKNIFSGFYLIYKKQRYPDYLILEVDTDKPGDLEIVNKVLSPDIVVLTAIGEIPAHVEEFGAKEAVLYEYKEYLKSLKPECRVIYNKDDLSAKSLVSEIEQKSISCSIGGEADINCRNVEILYGKDGDVKIPTGLSCEVCHKDESIKITIFDSIGINGQYATMLSCGLGLTLGMDFSETMSFLSKYKVLPGRMRIISGIKETIIIDDSYNSSPVAIGESLKSFEKLEVSGRKIVVTGDMLELGKYSSEEHKKLAHKIKDFSDFTVCVGIRSKFVFEELLNLEYSADKLIHFDNSEEAGKFLQNYIQKGDCIFIKGSQLMRMENSVEEIMRHPEDKKKLLARQDSKWLEDQKIDLKKVKK